jgi:hypothetical protein
MDDTLKYGCCSGVHMSKTKKKKNPLDDYLEELDKYEEGTEPREVEVDD